TVPQGGLEMTEGAIAAWPLNVGDEVKKGTAIADIETAKIVNTLEAGNDMPGVLRRTVAQVGDTLPVGAVIAVVAEPSVSEAEIDQYLVGQGVSAPAAAPAAPAPAAAAATPAAAPSAGVPKAEAAQPAPAAAPARVTLSAEELAKIAA